MEIIFKDTSNPRPVYDYQIKQEWEKHVAYQCPAALTPAELKAIERVARDTFEALDCRDVARVDLRMNAKGEIYVIEVNPLPGLTPGYSDLCLIASAAGIEYRTLIAEILSGGLKRLREKRRAEAAKNAEAQARTEGRSEERQLAIPRLPAFATPAPATIPHAPPSQAVAAGAGGSAAGGPTNSAPDVTETTQGAGPPAAGGAALPQSPPRAEVAPLSTPTPAPAPGGE
jgi:D-alanine-D-alanine ligase